MGRPKGSKNKSKTTTTVTPAPVKAPVLPPVVVETHKLSPNPWLVQVKLDIADRMGHYGLTKFPSDALTKQMSALENVSTDAQAKAAYERVLDRLQIHLWFLWSTGKISGPITEHNVEKRATQATSLANYLESMGQYENAAKQRQRAEDIRNSLK